MADPGSISATRPNCSVVLTILWAIFLDLRAFSLVVRAISMECVWAGLLIVSKGLELAGETRLICMV